MAAVVQRTAAIRDQELGLRDAARLDRGRGLEPARETAEVRLDAADVGPCNRRQEAGRPPRVGVADDPPELLAELVAGESL